MGPILLAVLIVTRHCFSGFSTGLQVLFRPNGVRLPFFLPEEEEEATLPPNSAIDYARHIVCAV